MQKNIYNTFKSILPYIILFCVIICLQACGIGGYNAGIWKAEFPYSGKFTNTAGINLAYRIRFPYVELNVPVRLPLFLFIDGSGPFPLGVHIDSLLSHFQSRGFIAAAIQKQGKKNVPFSVIL